MLARGLARRCPNCGGGRLFERWTRMKERCPTCGYKFERQEGFAVGAMAINIVVTLGVFLVLMVVGFIVTWPDPPLVPLIVGALVLNLVFPVVFYPFSKTIWAAVDLGMRPLDAQELAEANAAEGQSSLRRQAEPNAPDGV